MPSFMLDRKVLQPAGYAERSCVLVAYRLPLLKHCFVLCHDEEDGVKEELQPELMAFFLSQASVLAWSAVGDAQAFMLIHSGTSIRKRGSSHLHVFVVQRRWQKAWVYTVLAMKNIALACMALGRIGAASGRPASGVPRSHEAPTSRLQR